MKNRVLPFLIVVLISALFPTKYAVAGSHLKPHCQNMYNDLATSKVALARFSGTVDDCINTYVWVTLVDELRPNKIGDPVQRVSVSLGIDRYDRCTGTTLYSGYGETELDNSQFQIRPDLRMANMSIVIPVFNWETFTEHIIVFNLNWLGDGELLHDRFNSHNITPECKFVAHGSMKQRSATISGEVIDGTGNIIAGLVGTGALMDFARGYHTIQCN